MSNASILVISHRRSGTHWTIDTIRNNYPSTNSSYLTLERLLPWHEDHISLNEFQSLMNSKEGTSIVKTHLLATFGAFKREPELEGFVQNLLDRSKIIYVYRDGRDVLVSLYHYIRKFNQEISDMSFSDFIRMNNEGTLGLTEDVRFNRIEFWKFHVEGWLGRPDIFRLQYEQLHSNYEETVMRIANYLELKPPINIKRIELPTHGEKSNKIGKIISKTADMLKLVYMSNQIGKSSAVLPRKGVVGDWREYFSEEDLSLFNNVAGDLMEKLAYTNPK